MNYVIVEIIPTTRNPITGDIAQLSAIKKGKITKKLNLRLNKDKINIPDILRMTNYDNDKFEYLETTNEIMNKFIKFIEDYDLIIIPNDYTKEYLSNIKNNKISISDKLGIDYSELLIDDIINKYNLEYSNDIVGILNDAIKKHG